MPLLPDCHVYFAPGDTNVFTGPNNSSNAPTPEPDRPEPRCSSLLPSDTSPPVVGSTDLPFFCVYLFEDLDLHRLIGHHSFESRVLVFQGSQLPRLLYLHP